MKTGLPGLNGKYMRLFDDVFRNRRVLITGHTGFKGSWLALWLHKMGAIVKGYSLPCQISPGHWDLVNNGIEGISGDIRDIKKLEDEIGIFKPEIVFHLAAQAIVRQSYQDPVGTYETNVAGTLILYEACRKTDSVKAVVNITSDKCYDNKEWIYGYRENDSMGGYDPYSSSKGCSELLTSSYRNSFWHPDKYGSDHNVLLASCRAGNIIGGGDWALDRLVPDIVRAIASGGEIFIRNPLATRPWQHVLDALSGYLMVGQKLLEKNKSYAKAWNFGPSDEGVLYVKDVLERLKEYFPSMKVIYDRSEQPHEARLLKLDCSQAHFELKWRPVWGKILFEKTAVWYREFYKNGFVKTSDQIEEYIADAKKSGMIWTNQN